MPPLYHGIYTNAFGQRGQGFRHLFMAPEWPKADRERISRWLQTLQPLAQNPERIAVNCFRVGSRLHACLARIDADFARDEHGREGGVLVHGLFLPLDEGRPVGHYTGALLLKSRELKRPEIDDADRLEAYLGQCRQMREMALPTVNPEVFRRLDPNFLNRFYTFCEQPPQSSDAVFTTGGLSLTAALIAASAGLPPRLRLACRWAVGLRRTSEMAFVARPARGGESLKPLPDGPGTAYAHWLRQDYDAEVPESWNIRSWGDLMNRIR